MRTFAVVNQKGGCGKTTVSINLASALADVGKKTLLLDMDSQSHCAVGLAVPEEQVEQTIYDVLISYSRNEPVRLPEILWQISKNLELAPSSIDLTAFEQQTAGLPDREKCLQNVLQSVKDRYDYTIIDCPPAVGLLTFNALRAATDVIVPVETGYFALHGLSKQLETLNILCQRCSRKINIKVLASMYDIRTKMAREILAELRKHFADKMFKTTINFNTKIKEAASYGQPICEYDPASRGQMDFRTLAKEVIESETKTQKQNVVKSLTERLAAISVTADELLEAAKLPKQKDKKEKTLQPNLTATNARLSDYYGVNQIDRAVVFVTLYPRANSVQIAGDFNNWLPEKTQLQKVGDSGVWQTKVNLPTGKYRYRLVVDGQWQQDPYNENAEANPYGELNSVVEVK